MIIIGESAVTNILNKSNPPIIELNELSTMQLIKSMQSQIKNPFTAMSIVDNSEA